MHPDGIRTEPAGLKVRGLSDSWLHPKAFLSAFPENAGGQDHAPGIRAQQPILAACEGLCGALMEGVAPGTLRRLRAVCGLCGRRLTRRFFGGGISRGESSMGSGTRAAVLWVKSGGFDRPKKVLDKGRWSLATTSRPQSPAVRGFPGLWYRRRFSRFSKSRWSVRQKIQCFQAVAPCRSGTNIFPLRK